MWVVRYYSVAVVQSESVSMGHRLKGCVAMCRLQGSELTKNEARTSQRHPLCNRSLEFGCPALLGGIVESGLPLLQNGAVGAQREVLQCGDQGQVLSSGGGTGADLE